MNIKKYLFVLALLAMGATGCQQSSKEATQEYTAPTAGSIIASDTEPIQEDVLNHRDFAINIVATQNSNYGVYDIKASWGFDTATGTMTMPHGGAHLQPLLRRGTRPYSYIIGFHYGSDTTFHEYYGITATDGQVQMGYIKGYSFQ